RHVSRTYPGVQIIARAHDLQHVLELRQAGADDSVREVFDSAVRAGRHALAALGHHESEIELVARAFLVLDRDTRDELAQLWDPNLPLYGKPAYAARIREEDAWIEAQLREGAAARAAGEEPPAPAPPVQSE